MNTSLTNNISLQDNSLDKRIVIVADDFGINRPISEAIWRLVEKGSVTGIAVVANGFWFDQGLDQVFHGKSDLDICAHLNITDPLPMLSRGGRINEMRLGHFLVRSLTRTLDYGWIREEFYLQMERLCMNNLKIQQLNTHHHVHLDPRVLEILIDIAISYRVPYIRAPFEPLWCLKDLWSVRNWIKRLGVWKAQEFFGRLNGANIKTSGQFLGLYAHPFLSREYLNRLVSMVQPGFAELICHPSDETRHADFSTLDEVLDGALLQNNVRLTRFSTER